MAVKEDWEAIHSQKDWGRWPYPTVLKLISILTGKIPFEERPDCIVLDAGCGNGATILPFLLTNFTIHGLDISESAIRHTQKWLEQNDPPLAVGTIGALPYKDNAFDILIDFAVSQHNPYEELPGICAEFKRVLKRGGLLFTYYRARVSSHNDMLPKIYPLDIDELVNLIRPHFKIFDLGWEIDAYNNGTINMVNYHIFANKL